MVARASGGRFRIDRSKSKSKSKSKSGSESESESESEKRGVDSILSLSLLLRRGT